MTNGEKHIEKLLSWYKEAVTEDGVCYLTSDDKNTLAYAIKCCKHFEDIKKDIDSWGLREEPSSSEKPNKSEISTGSTTKSETLVSLGVYKQVAWERDIAIQQLHELGYEFGQKIEPTTKNDLEVDCISRKDVHDMLENLPITVEDKWFNWLQKACMRLAEMPSVTPQEPKTGRWIMTSDYLTTAYGSVDYVKCSCCGEDSLEEGNYCPNCGAEMSEVEE